MGPAKVAQLWRQRQHRFLRWFCNDDFWLWAVGRATRTDQQPNPKDTLRYTLRPNCRLWWLAESRWSSITNVRYFARKWNCRYYKYYTLLYGALKETRTLDLVKEMYRGGKKLLFSIGCCHLVSSRCIIDGIASKITIATTKLYLSMFNDIEIPINNNPSYKRNHAGWKKWFGLKHV